MHVHSLKGIKCSTCSSWCIENNDQEIHNGEEKPLHQHTKVTRKSVLGSIQAVFSPGPDTSLGQVRKLLSRTIPYIITRLIEEGIPSKMIIQCQIDKHWCLRTATSRNISWIHSKNMKTTVIIIHLGVVGGAKVRIINHRVFMSALCPPHLS